MVKFYIATSLSRAPQHNRVRDILLHAGHDITYDWTVHGSVRHVGVDRMSQVAEKELQAVLDADVVLVLLPGGPGTHSELGAALASDKRVIIHCEESAPFELGDQTCAFYHHPNTSHVVSPINALEPLVEAVSKSADGSAIRIAEPAIS